MIPYGFFKYLQYYLCLFFSYPVLTSPSQTQALPHFPHSLFITRVSDFNKTRKKQQTKTNSFK